MRFASLSAAAAFAMAASFPAASAAARAAPPPACGADGGLGFVCGQKNPEDLVVVPGTRWLVASGMTTDGGGLHLIDSRAKTSRLIYPDPKVEIRRDAARYPACAAPPPPGSSAHGLGVRSAGPGRAMLYVVGHGPREAVEIFALDSRGARPKLAWVGCVMLPAGLVGNAVTALADGTILTTVLFRNGRTLADSFAGKPTGVVLGWRPGQDRFSPIAGAELPANNGIETSADGRFIYVVSSGSKRVTEFSARDLSHPLRFAQFVGFAPDNVRLSPDGMLLVAGMIDDEPACGGPPKNLNFACHRGYMIGQVDPRTMQGRTIAQGPRNPSFSGATTALHVGQEMWVASLMGDRVAYRPWP